MLRCIIESSGERQFKYFERKQLLFYSPLRLPQFQATLTDVSKFLVYKSCAELYKAGKRISGVYTIDPDNAEAFDVFCDQTTAGGGWTVFQKRLDGSVDFYRGWDDYKRGFGNLNGEFWLGLDKIHRLTKQRSRLRVDLEDTTGKTAYAEYDFFGVASENSKYKLSLGTYSGMVFYPIILPQYEVNNLLHILFGKLF